jgi:hypothetical protein
MFGWAANWRVRLFGWVAMFGWAVRWQGPGPGVDADANRPHSELQTRIVRSRQRACPPRSNEKRPQKHISDRPGTVLSRVKYHARAQSSVNYLFLLEKPGFSSRWYGF